MVSERSVTARRWVVVALAAAVVLGAVAGWRLWSGPGPSGDVLLRAAQLSFSSTELEATAGEVEVTLANTDAVTHTFTVPALGVDLVVEGGAAAAATFDAEPGDYPFLCTVPGHDVPGMRGVLRVR